MNGPRAHLFLYLTMVLGSPGAARDEKIMHAAAVHACMRSSFTAVIHRHTSSSETRSASASTRTGSPRLAPRPSSSRGRPPSSISRPHPPKRKSTSMRPLVHVRHRAPLLLASQSRKSIPYSSSAVSSSSSSSCAAAASGDGRSACYLHCRNARHAGDPRRTLSEPAFSACTRRCARCDETRRLAGELFEQCVARGLGARLVVPRAALRPQP